MTPIDHEALLFTIAEISAAFVGVFLVAWNSLFPSTLSPGRYIAALLTLLAVAGIAFLSATFYQRDTPP